MLSWWLMFYYLMPKRMKRMNRNDKQTDASGNEWPSKSATEHFVRQRLLPLLAGLFVRQLNMSITQWAYELHTYVMSETICCFCFCCYG